MKGNDLNMYETKVKIDGMMCSHCTGTVTKVPIDEAKLREAITKTGYDFVSMTSKPYEKHALFGFLKK